ncbi:MAG TPA: type I glyceraldehyde-3-phosphate dehydrogenase [Natronosporangium sp.]
MATRIGVNGVGRIGRNLWRIIQQTAPDIEIAVVNDTADLATVAYLLRYDSMRGRFPGSVEAGDDSIVVDGRPVPMLHYPSPELIPWRRYGVDLVVESTGQFTRVAGARGHLRGGARRVIVTTASPDADTSLMMGINEQVFDPQRHQVVSNSCCTTYCLAMMMHALHHVYGVRSATASVAYSHGSRPGPLLDDPFGEAGDPVTAADGRWHHGSNPRIARANAVNLVPANVPGVRYALDRVLPELAGRVVATAVRVPVRATSAASMVLRLLHPADAEDLNATLEAAAASLLKGYLEVSRAPLVASDVLGSPASCVVDAGLTRALGDLVQLVGWYDNEWGYAHRLVDLIRYIAHRNGH